VSANWHHARNLWPVAEGAMGHTPEQRRAHMATELMANKQWERGERDFSWYDTPMYAYSCVQCFLDFSKTSAGNFAAWLVEHGEDREVETVIDYCCGVGATTRLMRERAPSFKFVAHNLPGASRQNMVAQALGVAPIVKEEHQAFPRYEAVAAFEYLEHCYLPLVQVDFWEKHGAGVICEASSFNIPDYGHFPEYQMDNGAVVGRKDAGKAFTKGMRDRGWRVQSDMEFWNGRPRVWVLE
jgi:hypothetical protein